RMNNLTAIFVRNWRQRVIDVFCNIWDCRIMTSYLLAITFTVCVSSCVSPPEYKDGLIENIPAVVDETDYFSLSILGDEYSEEKEWNITLLTDSSDVILTTLVVKDLNIGNSDSSFLFLIDDSSDTMFAGTLVSEMVWASEDSVSADGSPKIVKFLGDNFTGRLEYQIIKNPDN
ncbi:uncharacterized protein METZ01_LOCUS321542, partial [marine metagenome]